MFKKFNKSHYKWLALGTLASAIAIKLAKHVSKKKAYLAEDEANEDQKIVKLGGKIKFVINSRLRRNKHCICTYINWRCRWNKYPFKISFCIKR